MIESQRKGYHDMKTPTPVTVEEFKTMLLKKEIRPASLEDVWGTHHSRLIYLHPNTKQPYVKVK
jgi:hypothetical protein